MIDNWTWTGLILVLIALGFVIWGLKTIERQKPDGYIEFRVPKDKVIELCGIEVAGPCIPIVGMTINGILVKFYKINHINKDRIDLDKLLDFAAKQTYMNGILRGERHKAYGPENQIKRECYKEKEWDTYGWWFNIVGDWFNRMDVWGPY